MNIITAKSKQIVYSSDKSTVKRLKYDWQLIHGSDETKQKIIPHLTF